MTPRATLTEIREILLNMASTLDGAERMVIEGSECVVILDCHAQGMSDGCRDMAAKIKGVLEGM